MALLSMTKLLFWGLKTKKKHAALFSGTPNTREILFILCGSDVCIMLQYFYDSLRFFIPFVCRPTGHILLLSRDDGNTVLCVDGDCISNPFLKDDYILNCLLRIKLGIARFPSAGVAISIENQRQLANRWRLFDPDKALQSRGKSHGIEGVFPWSCWSILVVIEAYRTVCMIITCWFQLRHLFQMEGFFFRWGYPLL